jgi:hypothetical protein
MDRRSILYSTILLFAAAILVGLTAVATVLFLFHRRGKKALEAEPPGRA